MILPITLTVAGAAALINVWLGWRVGQRRMSEKVSIGDGGNELLTCRMRAHANFAEYTPFVVILIGLIELAAGTTIWLWAVGAIYLLARIAHPLGMDRPAPNPLRMVGIMVTMLTLAGLGLYAVALPQLAPSAHAGGAEAVAKG
ncbi:MAPEG family protein [Sphingomonas tabacisoli]|uniref:MAPEG family protein n=1 Tax=Sphingomonas tabacisoli TaxID=2249466 RepID=A0ABW4I0E8_9SPHN